MMLKPWQEKLIEENTFNGRCRIFMRALRRLLRLKN